MPGSPLPVYLNGQTGLRGVAMRGIFYLTYVIGCTRPFYKRLAWMESAGQTSCLDTRDVKGTDSSTLKRSPLLHLVSLTLRTCMYFSRNCTRCSSTSSCGHLAAAASSSISKTVSDAPDADLLTVPSGIRADHATCVAFHCVFGLERV